MPLFSPMQNVVFLIHSLMLLVFGSIIARDTSLSSSYNHTIVGPCYGGHNVLLNSKCYHLVIHFVFSIKCTVQNISTYLIEVIPITT